MAFLFEIVVQLTVVVGVMLVVATVGFVDRERLVRTRHEYRERLRSVAPYLGLLAVVLVANKVARDVGPGLSWIIGWDITGTIQRIDGFILTPFYGEEYQFVVFLQSFATPELTLYFSFIYVYGYVFLLVFPLVAYFALERPEPLRRTIVAYSTNYVVGVTCYVLFIAWGPRNKLAGAVGQPLYQSYPQYQLLTTAINTNVNVFPSLHASLAATAAILAWWTRDEYPRWVPMAFFLAASVVMATMYLGIHWATDVLAGFALAVISVRIGAAYEEQLHIHEWPIVRSLLAVRGG